MPRVAEPLRIRRRRAVAHQLPASLNPVLQRVYAARGIVDPALLPLDLSSMLPPTALHGLDTAVRILIDAIRRQEKIVVVGDYDADGATGVALAVLGLRALGATAVDYAVPHRVTMGYGLSPALAETAHAMGARLLVTVDNGIASLAGVDAAHRLGMRVIVTDHHLPGPELPAADALVNPNQPDCEFPSKCLAGVGVMFYLLAALRAELRAMGLLTEAQSPRLADWLDLVALGTVADVAKLDRNNRILVAQGIARIRQRRARPGLLALLECAGRDPAQLTVGELGFVLGPRINAAGRLADIRIGIECLLAEDIERARPLAQALETINRERRDIQQGMTDAALVIADNPGDDGSGFAHGICVFAEDWHEGVVGPVASRLKDQLRRPVIAFAPAQEAGLLKGSARSISGLNIRDVIAMVDAAHPGVVQRFGGHAMAAGLSLRKSAYRAFREAFDAACSQLMPADWEDTSIDSDGPLEESELKVETALGIESGGPWGAGFEEPRFDNVFQVLDARIVGGDGTHAKYRLRLQGGQGGDYQAIDFGGAARLCRRGSVQAVYALGVNRFRDRETLDLRIHQLQALDSGSA